MAIELEFGSRSAANSFRDDVNDDYLTERYDRRHKTVELTEDVPDALLDRATVEAESSKAERGGKGAGQVPLTEGEKSRIDFSEGRANVFHAQSVKALLQSEGVDDWLSYYDPTLSVDEHRSSVGERPDARTSEGELATMSGSGVHLEEDHDDTQVQERRSQSMERSLGGQCDHARNHCENGDPDACEFLGDRCGFDEDEIDDLLEPPVDEEDVEEITGKALGALKRAWGGYHGAIAELRDCIESTVEAWNNAQQAARTINRVREGHGQEPLELENLQEQQARLSAFASVAADDCHECQGLPDATNRDVEQALEDVGDETDTEDVLEIEQSAQADLSGEQKTRKQQASFSVDDDVRLSQGRESRHEAEQSTGGIMADTRADASRGAEREQESTEQQSFRDPKQRDLTHE